MRATLITALASSLASSLYGDRDVVTVSKPTGYRSPPPHRYSRGTPVKPYRLSAAIDATGTKAAARRRRQIERGQLKAENGLARGA